MLYAPKTSLNKTYKLFRAINYFTIKLIYNQNLSPVIAYDYLIIDYIIVINITVLLLRKVYADRDMYHKTSNLMTLSINGQIEKFTSILFSKKHEASEAASRKIENKILVGTHHKTGTVWMKNIFSQSCNKLKLKFYNGKLEQSPSDFDVLLQEHSQFDLDKLNAEYKGLHVIRDPRDIIISGCFYHQKAHEKWLHVPQDKFGGLTYQEKIKSYETLDDQILFEMENSSLWNIQAITNWNYNNPAFFEAKYENLIADVDLLLFHQIFTFLGFPGQSIPEILKIAYKNSIFSGNLRKTLHVRAAKEKQWEKYFKPKHKAKFLNLYGDVLIKLGYENNHDWANS